MMRPAEIATADGVLETLPAAHVETAFPDGAKLVTLLKPMR